MPAHIQLIEPGSSYGTSGGRFSDIYRTAPTSHQVIATCLRLKSWIVTQGFDDDAGLKASVNEWLKSQTVNFYEDGLCKLVHHYDKCSA